MHIETVQIGSWVSTFREMCYFCYQGCRAMSECDLELNDQFDRLIPRKCRYWPPTKLNGVKISKSKIWKYNDSL